MKIQIINNLSVRRCEIKQEKKIFGIWSGTLGNKHLLGAAASAKWTPSCVLATQTQT